MVYRLLTSVILAGFISSCALLNSLPYLKKQSPDEELIPEYQLVEAVLLEAILPWHNALEADLNALHNETARFCIKPSMPAFTKIKQSWFQAMHSWSTVAPINFGPIDDTNVAWRFQFWPDPLNYVHRKFKSRLSGKNPAISVDDLKGTSVAIQGLSALEYLLFDPQVADVESYKVSPHKCKILTGTANNLALEGSLLTKAWQTTYKNSWLNIRLGQDRAEHSKHHLELIYNGMLTSLQVIKDKKLALPLGINADKAPSDSPRKIRPKHLENWRSQTSLLHIRQSLQAIEELYTMPEGFSWYLTRQGQNSELDQRIKLQFINLREQLYVSELSAFERLAGGDIAAMDALYGSISELFSLLRKDYMSILNLHYRFNSLDGD